MYSMRRVVISIRGTTHLRLKGALSELYQALRFNAAAT